MLTQCLSSYNSVSEISKQCVSITKLMLCDADFLLDIIHLELAEKQLAINDVDARLVLKWFYMFP